MWGSTFFSACLTLPPPNLLSYNAPTVLQAGNAAYFRKARPGAVARAPRARRVAAAKPAHGCRVDVARLARRCSVDRASQSIP